MNILQEIDESQCVGCASCVSNCKQGAIKMVDKGDGFKYPYVFEEKCIDCGLCIKGCPVNKVYPRKFNLLYVGHAQKSKKLEEGSSGGIIPVLAEWVISEGGIVYGAAESEEHRIRHLRIEKFELLKKIYKSRYVQSDTEEIYMQVKRDLIRMKKVLFVGTPCQVAGLLCFLGKTYSNLITVDFLCHGVPSPGLWKKYVEYQGMGNNIDHINFRDKITGWKNFGFGIYYSSGRYRYQLHSENSYMRIFLSDLCLRKSCYQCEFKEDKHLSDMTVADYWGEPHYTGVYDKKGTSIICVNSQQGLDMFNKIQKDLVYEKADKKWAFNHNDAYAKQPNIIERNAFFEDYSKLNFKELERKYCWIRSTDRIKKILLRIKRIKCRVLEKIE